MFTGPLQPRQDKRRGGGGRDEGEGYDGMGQGKRNLVKGKREGEGHDGKGEKDTQTIRRTRGVTQKGGDRRGEDCNNTAEARKRREHEVNEEGRMDLRENMKDARKG